MADEITITFRESEADLDFRVEPTKRTISGLVVPWGAVADNGRGKFRFEPGSIDFSGGTRIKLNLNHNHNVLPIGVAQRFMNRADGLDASFKIAEVEAGNQALAYAKDQVLDGFSVEVRFSEDSLYPDPSDRTINVVKHARLTGVALTHEPAFEGARVEGIAASQKSKREVAAMAPESKKEETQDESASALAEFSGKVETALNRMASAAELQAEKTQEAVGRGIAAYLADRGDELYVPKAYPNIQFISEPVIYSFGRTGIMGPSIVRDAYYAHFMRDQEAHDRYMRFMGQQSAMKNEIMKLGRIKEVDVGGGAQFAMITTSGASQIIPPGYRPDMYVPELLQGRPFTDGCSRGTIDNASPFTVPIFSSASGRTSAVAVEGTNPASGATTFGTKTVQPLAYSGIMEITREIADASNPVIDQILMQGMREEYARDTEAAAYAMFNHVTLGLGGTITSGFVPSGAQAAVTSGQGDELLVGIRTAFSLYPFRRFIGPNQGVLSQEATSALATGVDSTGRHLLPYVGAMNAVGTSNARAGDYNVDGLTFRPAWSITGNAAGDFDVAFWNDADVWVFESPLLMFRYEEVLGPGAIRLGLWGYYGVHILRPVGVSGIRHTAA